MTLIKKIQLAAEQKGFNVWVTGDKRKYKQWKVSIHRGLPYKVITGDGLFENMCSHLIKTKENTEGYQYVSHLAGVLYTCSFIDGGFKYVILKQPNSTMILVYKN